MSFHGPWKSLPMLRLVGGSSKLKCRDLAMIRSTAHSPILSYAILSYPVLSYLILSYPILPYPILSYPILSASRPKPLDFCYRLLPHNIIGVGTTDDPNEPRTRRECVNSNLWKYHTMTNIQLSRSWRHESVPTPLSIPLRWRQNGRDSVSNHQPHDCLFNRLFRRRSKKTSKLRVTGLCVGNSPGAVNSPHKGPVTRKMFPFDDVIMTLSIYGPEDPVHQCAEYVSLNMYTYAYMFVLFSCD